MRGIKEALQLTDLDQLREEITERRELLDNMVGTLYPSIIRDELILLNQLYNDIYYHIVPNPKRRFYQMLFHGNGEQSKRKLDVLIERLNYGHSVLCGLQQGVDLDSDEHTDGENKIKDVCRDILASFGYSDKGLEWEELPYPTVLQQIVDNSEEQIC